MNKRKGFILYVVITLLLALAILAFALNDFKRGAVTQLAKNIDQNRLILIAQSANAETLALIRSKVNDADDQYAEDSDPYEKQSPIFKNFRKVFPKNGESSSAHLNQAFSLFSRPYQPPETLLLIEESGYPIKVETTATVKCFSDSQYKSLSQYNGFLDIVSKAYIENDEENSIVVSERHDVRLIDLRHNLDKYVLFLKQYCPDLNNTKQRIYVHGGGPYLSRVYLGTDNYPNTNCPEDEKKLWLDLDFNTFYKKQRNDSYPNVIGLNTLTNLFGVDNKGSFMQGKLAAFQDNTGDEYRNFFYTNKIKFKDFNTLPNEAFFHVKSIKKTYEDFVNDAADACDGNTNKTERKTGAELKAKCEREMPKTNSNSAVYQICKDYVNNYRPSSNELDEDGNDYSNCEIFNKVLNTCIENWDYCYGYLDGEHIWNFKEEYEGRPKLPEPQLWSKSLAYRGLVDRTIGDGYGPFVSAYKGYNSEEYQVGKMLNLYGSNSKKTAPVLVEGNVWVRFFKIAYFDDFEDKITLYNNTEGKIHPEPVPISFRRHNLEPITFQNSYVEKEFSSNKEYFSDHSLMSQPISCIPINALILGSDGNGPIYLDGNGKEQQLTKADAFNPNKFLYPAQKDGPTKVPAKNFGRLIDLDKVSYNYPSPKEFLEDRLSEDKKTLCLDGIMYIEKGDLDLSSNENGEPIASYTGRGLVYIGEGNVTFATFQKNTEKDSARFYLRKGDFLTSHGGLAYIRASLVALNHKPGSTDPRDQGNLIMNGNNNEVKIVGNLVLDYLSTRELPKDKDGLEVMHDALINNPGCCTKNVGVNSPYHISIGKIKTAYSVKAGGD